MMRKILRKLVLNLNKHKARKNINKRKENKHKITSFHETIDVVILNWNRAPLLRTTVLSLFANTINNFNLIVIDNNSTDSSRKWLEYIEKKYENLKCIFLDKNIGGEAINRSFPLLNSKYIMIAENDLEFLPGWDLKLIEKFEKFPKLGFLSPFSPSPMTSFGEVWAEKAYRNETNTAGDSLLVANQNIGTSGMLRNELIHLGVHYSSLGEGAVKLPADASFSNQIKNLGYQVAWSDQYVVINWGHNKESFHLFDSYYQNNWNEKAKKKIDGIGLKRNQDEQSANSLYLLEQELYVWKNKYNNLILKLQPEDRKNITLELESNLFIKHALYWDADRKISSTLSIQQRNFKVKFKNIPIGKKLRWDPLEGYPCKIVVHSINKEHDLSNYELKSNGIDETQNTFSFENNYDPQIYIKSLTSVVEIEGEIDFLLEN